MTLGLEIIRGGLTAQIQDKGRFGYSEIGVTESGPMDFLAYYWANKLLANPLPCSQLEVANGGIVLRSHINTSIAVTGVETSILINGKPVPLWQSLTLKPGDELTISPPKAGVFNYLAIRGGFQIPPVLNSVATSSREGLGGLLGDGKRLSVGQVLPAFESKQRISLQLPEAYRPVYNKGRLTVRLIPGYQYFDFGYQQKRLLLRNVYTIDKHSNRMGYRLNSLETHSLDLPVITSEGVSYGAVQVPSPDELIVMLNERQTLGGYPKLGTLFAPDCWKLAQCKGGTKVNFEIIRLSVAQNAYRQLIHSMENIKLHDISPSVVA